MDTISEVARLLKGHKCRVDGHRPAGGAVCNICQATFALDALRRRLMGIAEALAIVADARPCPPKVRPGLKEAAKEIAECAA